LDPGARIGGQITTNRKEARGAASEQRTAGDVFYTRTFKIVDDDGRTQFYWVQVPYPQMSNEEAIKTQEWYGPFNSKEQAEKNSQLTHGCKMQ